jgi:steroid delta-isomerase-like uncharacterized protein
MKSLYLDHHTYFLEGYWMSLEENKSIVIKMFQAINRQDLDAVEELMRHDFVVHMQGNAQGRAASRKFLSDEFSAFPDLKVDVETIVAEGDMVCVRLKETATHVGVYRGLTPTGRRLSYSVAGHWRLIDGRIKEGWIVYDQLDFLTQLGVTDFQEFQEEIRS